MKIDLDIENFTLSSSHSVTVGTRGDLVPVMFRTVINIEYEQMPRACSLEPKCKYNIQASDF